MGAPSDADFVAAARSGAAPSAASADRRRSAGIVRKTGTSSPDVAAAVARQILPPGAERLQCRGIPQQRPPMSVDDNLDYRFQNLHEFVKVARQNLNRNNWDYLIGGSETETTLARNRLALDSIGFRPRVLRDVSNVDCTKEVF